jgi:hypothetical protein
MARLQEMRLTRKYRTAAYWLERLSKASGGKFQGANRVDFTDAITLHEIIDTLSLSMTIFPVYHAAKFKYVRYIAPDSPKNSIAEPAIQGEKKATCNQLKINE